MAEVKELTIDRFDLGILDQKRDLPNGYFKYLENLEIGSDVRGALQTYNTTNTGGSPTERSLRKVLEINGTFWALGNDGSNDTGIWKGVSAGTWTSYTITANYGLDWRDNPFFVYDNGYLLFHNNEKIGLFKLSDQTNNGDFLSLANGLWGGMMWQGNPYGWNGQKIYKIDVGDYSSTQTITEMLDMPDDQTIVQLLDYGNLMAIICTSTTKESLMYLWDGVTTTTFYDIIKIGRGTVAGGAVLNGIITVVVENDKDIIIKQYDEVVLRTRYLFKTRPDVSGDIGVILYRVREYNGYMYILGISTRPDGTGASTGQPVVYRYGRKTDLNQPLFCIYKYFDYTQTDPTNVIADLLIHESVLTAVYGVPSIFALTTEDDAGDVDANIKEIRTNAAKNVNVQVGIIETGIYTLDASVEKQLKRVNIQLVPLPATGKVVVKYKANAETTWTTIATNTVDNTITHDIVNVESTGVNLPVFNEIAFRIELSGGAEITAFKAKYEEKYGI